MPAYMREADQDKRRIPPNEPRKTWQVTEMWELHHEIARRLLLGQKNTVIAQALNCHPQTISLIRNSPVVQDHLDLMKGAADANAVDVAQRITEMAPEALDVLKEVLEAKETASLSLRAKVAGDILDRAGHSAIRTVRTEGIHAHLTSDDLERIKARALEKARDAGIVVDITQEDKAE